MKLLLDTHLLLWAAGEPGKLSRAAKKLLSDPENNLIFSAASLWEISIKRSLGRSDFRVEPRLLRRGLRDNGYIELAISGDHALEVESLPQLHKDPFDRMLVAQAIVEGITLLTVDTLLPKYSGHVKKV